MRTLSVLSATLAVLSSACGAGTTASPTSPEVNERTVAAGEVTVSRVAGGVRLVNGTDRPVAYAVWNKGWLALFAPCVDSSPECTRLAAGASVVVADQDIAGAAPGMTEAVVRWWFVVPAGAGGYRAEGLREVTIAL